MKQPRRWKGGWSASGSAGGIVPHHPVTHGGKPAHRKPQPPAKVHKKPKPPPKPKKPAAKKPVRKFSPGSDVACCAAEAFGALVIASGRPWSAEDTLALYWWCTADHPDAGASLSATLEAAQQFGFSRRRLQFVTALAGGFIEAHEASRPEPPHQFAARSCPAADDALAIPAEFHGLILGVTLPEPHAVAVTPDGRWWSWGEPFHPDQWPDLEIDEAWAVLL